jgi:hypothetical protein
LEVAGVIRLRVAAGLGIPELVDLRPTHDALRQAAIALHLSTPLLISN